MSDPNPASRASDDPSFDDEEVPTSATYRKFCERISRLDQCRTEVVTPLNDKLDQMLQAAKGRPPR